MHYRVCSILAHICLSGPIAQSSVATMPQCVACREAYQASDQLVELVKEDNLASSQTDIKNLIVKVLEPPNKCRMLSVVLVGSLGVGAHSYWEIHAAASKISLCVGLDSGTGWWVGLDSGTGWWVGLDRGFLQKRVSTCWAVGLQEGRTFLVENKPTALAPVEFFYNHVSEAVRCLVMQKAFASCLHSRKVLAACARAYLLACLLAPFLACSSRPKTCKHASMQACTIANRALPSSAHWKQVAVSQHEGVFRSNFRASNRLEIQVAWLAFDQICQRSHMNEMTWMELNPSVKQGFGGLCR